MVLQCINGVSSNPVEGRTKNLTAQKSNSNTVWFNFQTYIIYIYNIYIYIYIYIYIKCSIKYYKTLHVEVNPCLFKDYWRFSDDTQQTVYL